MYLLFDSCDPDDLVPGAYQVTFCGAGGGIIYRCMPEVPGVKIGSQFTVEPLQQVQVKVAGVSGFIIVCLPDNLRVLLRSSPRNSLSLLVIIADNLCRKSRLSV